VFRVSVERPKKVPERHFAYEENVVDRRRWRQESKHGPLVHRRVSRRQRRSSYSFGNHQERPVNIGLTRSLD